MLTLFDPNLTLTRTQYPINVGNTGAQKSLLVCGICKLVQSAATPDRTLVKRLGQRFESARRLSTFTCKFHKNKMPPMVASGALSAVDYPKASSLALACYKWLQGTARGVGEPCGIDCLADVPEFGWVRHRRKSFARVPRS